MSGVNDTYKMQNNMNRDTSQDNNNFSGSEQRLVNNNKSVI